MLSFVGQVDLNPAVGPVYTECLRLCGNWLAETCLESPGVILEKYLERVGRSLWYSDSMIALFKRPLGYIAELFSGGSFCHVRKSG